MHIALHAPPPPPPPHPPPPPPLSNVHTDMWTLFVHVSVGCLVVKEVTVRFTVQVEGAPNREHVDMHYWGEEVLKCSAPPVVKVLAAFKCTLLLTTQGEDASCISINASW